MRGENCILAARIHSPLVRNAPAGLTWALYRSRLRVKSLPNCFVGSCLYVTVRLSTAAHTVHQLLLIGHSTPETTVNLQERKYHNSID